MRTINMSWIQTSLSSCISFTDFSRMLLLLAYMPASCNKNRTNKAP